MCAWGGISSKVLTILLFALGMPATLFADAQADYDAVNKSQSESSVAQSIATLHKYTEGPPRLMFLTEQLPPTFAWHGLERATLRLEMLTEYEGHLAYSSCTATLISPTQVITAAHCVPGNGPGIVSKAKVVSYHSSRGILARSDIDLGTGPLLSLTAEDISILTLSTPFPDSFVPYPLKVRAPIVGETLVIVSHPLGQSKRLSSGNCRVAAERSPMPSQFYHSCLTFPASSGALVVAGSDGAVVGVHSEAQDNASIANRLVSVDGLTPFVEVVSPPATPDTSGWVLQSGLLTSGFAAAIRSGEARSWLDTMFNESSDFIKLNDELKLTQTAVELHAVDAVTLLKARGVGLSSGQAGQYLKTLVYGPWNSAKRDMIRYLLAQHAEVGLRPDTGYPIYCGTDVLGAVKQVFSESGYGQEKCHPQ